MDSSISRYRSRIVICALVLCMSWPGSGICQDYLYGFGIAPSFSSGDYGTGDDVDIFYLPMLFKFYPSERIRGTVVVPWVHQSSTQVISAGGTFFGIKGRNNRGNRKAYPAGTTVVTDAPATKDSESGLGDIILRGAYTLVQETVNSPEFTIEGQIKLPTASESKGLGTGELDLGISAEVARTIARYDTFGRLGLVQIGEPSGADFDNVLVYEAGAGSYLFPKFYLTLSLEGRTSADDDVDDPLDAVVSGSYALRRDLDLNAFLLIGLSDGSPDYGIGVGFLQKY